METLERPGAPTPGQEMEQMSARNHERPTQYRPTVPKAEGVTQSERYLAKLAEKSFLNLWSYPTPFRDQQQSGRGDGKELCDLLVVCGRYIVIFSEKTISWPNGNLTVAWCRWAKRAVRDAAKQAKGAERWITQFPERIFLDRLCKTPFPINLPLPEERIIHRVVVVRGAASACREHVPGSSGSLIVSPQVRGEQHWSGTPEAIKPFCVGDVDPSGSFVHVVNESSLEVMMQELDTIGDFTDYLEKKALFVRSGQLSLANGEENMVAYYAIRINDRGQHDFLPHGQLFGDGHAAIKIDGTHYRRMATDPRYFAKKQADEISYLWDALIESFTTHMLGGTSATLGRYKFDLRKSELGVRYMALERRFFRRSHGEAVRGALQAGMTKDIFFRMMIASANLKESETAFFIITFRFVRSRVPSGSYEEYRLMRTNFAQIYATGILERFHHLKRVIGISREPPGQGNGVSEDMVYAEQADWTEKERMAIKRDCERCGILRDDIRVRRWYGREYPDPA